MLPFVLKRAIILIAVCIAAVSIIAFCIKSIQKTDTVIEKLRIGYVAEENILTDFAVSYVQNMESVQNLCILEAVSEQEGRQLLEEGELSALIVLPKDVLNEILSGSNTPAKLYLPSKKENAVTTGGLQAIGSMLFEELASAGMGMLGTAQAEIYAASKILEEMITEYHANENVTDAFLQEMYDDINRFNLGVVTNREDLFNVKSLSVTGNDTYAVYYGSALFTIYIMLCGLFIGSFCKRTNLQQVMAAKRIGVGYIMQLFSKCLAGSLLMLFIILLPLSLFLIPQMKELLSVNLTGGGILSLVWIIIFAIVYHMFLYQIVEKRESALVVIGISAMLQAYLSGCLIPSVLLPEVINKIGALLPAAFIKAGFTVFLTGETRQFSHAAEGLMIWSLILFLTTLGFMHIGERKQPENAHKAIFFREHVPSVCMVLLKRLLHKKSIWLCMGLAAVLSMTIVGAEKNSETQIRAGIYDESGDYAALLEAYDGLVSFELFDSIEQMQKAVLNDTVECAYILPKDLTEDMIARKANRSVTVYQDADAVTVPVVNEVLFEQIFGLVSLRWYEDYIAQNRIIAALGAEEGKLQKKVDSIFEKQLASGATFDFKIERIGDEQENSDEEENETTYPVQMVVIVTIFLCTLQGVVQVILDIRERRFYKRNRVAMSLLTILLPVLLGLFTGVFILSAVFLLTL